MQPGSEGLCPLATGGGTYKVCMDDDPTCRMPLNTDACGDSYADAAAADSGSGSSLPVAAVAVPVTVVAAAGALTAVLLWRRRRRRDE